MGKKLNIVFMGTSDIAAIVLESLIEKKYKITTVVTQPDYKEKVKIKIISPVKKVSIEHEITTLQPTKLDGEFIKKISDLKPDLLIVTAYGKILPTELLEIPKYKALNVHASILPKWRGPSPIQNSLLNNESKSGITIMLMDQGVDTGDILAMKSVAIAPKDNYITLTSKLALTATIILEQTIPKWIAHKIKPQPQNPKKATMCQLIEKRDGKIIWDDEAKVIFNKFRAFYLWPGIFTFWEKEKGRLLKISLSEVAIAKHNSLEDHKFGEVFQYSKKQVGIQTGLGVIILKKIQLEGKKETDINSFLNGYPSFLGSILK